MHDQSASRISGRTRAAVSAMCVRALRITVLKSAGDFTRHECHDLNAEKIQRVNYFMFTRCGFVACQQFSNAGAAGWVRKFQVAVLAEMAVLAGAMSALPSVADSGRIPTNLCLLSMACSTNRYWCSSHVEGYLKVTSTFLGSAFPKHRNTRRAGGGSVHMGEGVRRQVGAGRPSIGAVGQALI